MVIINIRNYEALPLVSSCAFMKPTQNSCTILTALDTFATPALLFWRRLGDGTVGLPKAEDTQISSLQVIWKGHDLSLDGSA